MRVAIGSGRRLGQQCVIRHVASLSDADLGKEFASRILAWVRGHLMQRPFFAQGFAADTGVESMQAHATARVRQRVHRCLATGSTVRHQRRSDRQR